MKSLYSKPKKLYFVIIAFTLLGIVLSQFLPVNLFPNSSKPEFWVSARLINLTDSEFYNKYGSEMQSLLRKIDGVEKVTVEGRPGSMEYTVYFKWGADAKKAEREIQSVIENIRPMLPLEMQLYLQYGQSQRNSAVFVASISSPDGDLSSLKKALEPLVYNPIKRLDGVKSVGLVDPNWQNIYITVNPEKAIFHRIDVFKLKKYLQFAISSIYPGKLQLGENRYQVLLENRVKDYSELADLTLDAFGSPGLKLKDIATVELKTSPEGTEIFKTDGKQSLILFVNPTDNANLKEVCDKVAGVLKKSFPNWPKGSLYKVLINPSIMINAAVHDVYESILLGGFFAVLILLLFVGSLKLTIFSALEIPLAIAWSFILMYFNNVGVNLVSLGGLALSAGMNVDASVVMVENILRHFELPANKTRDRLDVIIDAVNEVKWPIVTSTLTAVIVFLPLSMTSGITYAILGDLAKAVVFSHVFSAVVAIFLVPTIRSQMNYDLHDMNSISRRFNIIYDGAVNVYRSLLYNILLFRRRRVGIPLVAMALVVGVSYFLFPKIKKEVIATPRTDMVWVSVSVQGVATTEEAAAALDPYEKKIKNEISQYVDYTFTQVWSKDSGGIIAKLKNKNQMREAMKELENKLPSTPYIQFRVFPSNPSKLPIPNPPHLSVKITGPETERIEYAERLKMELRGTRMFSWLESTISREPQFTLKPEFHVLENLHGLNGPTLFELGDIISTGIRQQNIGYLKSKDETKYVYLQYPEKWFRTAEDLAAIPIIAGTQILPLSALAQIKLEDIVSGFYIEDDSRYTSIEGYFTQEARDDKYNNEQKMKKLVNDLPRPKDVQIIVEDSNIEVDKSLRGLILAFAISLLLIGVIVYWQFESICDVIIVKAAIPLGMLGVSLALYLFDSTWSINSFLGVILLGGIAVNNSIILVSFYNQCRSEGLSPVDAAVKSASIRMRPVLITSLTTILAMVPIALGWGQGGEVLQPLGISVSFGMLFSTVLTLFVIPCLEVVLDSKHA